MQLSFLSLSLSLSLSFSRSLVLSFSRSLVLSFSRSLSLTHPPTHPPPWEHDWGNFLQGNKKRDHLWDHAIILLVHKIKHKTLTPLLVTWLYGIIVKILFSFWYEQ